MHYYLTRWTGRGTHTSPYRPDFDTPQWSVIDLRPDPTARDGLCLVGSVQRPDREPPGGLHLGDDGDARLPAAVHGRLGNRLGLNVEPRSLRWLVMDLLTVHARTDGTRWRPLQPATWHNPRLPGLRVPVWEVWLGGERLLSLAVPAGGAIYSESFTGANNTDIAAGTYDLTWTDVVTGWGVSSNQGAMNASGAVAYARASGTSASSDTFAQATLITKTDSGTDWSQFGACVRWDSSANTSYMACRGQNAATDFNLRSTVGGGRSTLATATQALALPEVVAAQVSGSTLKGLINGTQVVTVTDTSITTGTLGGIYGYRPTPSQSVVIDNYLFGDLASLPTSPPVRPIVVSHPTAIYRSRSWLGGATFASGPPTDISTGSSTATLADSLGLADSVARSAQTFTRTFAG